jgi:thioredoxin-like negative regulator of GroEL
MLLIIAAALLLALSACGSNNTAKPASSTSGTASSKSAATPLASEKAPVPRKFVLKDSTPKFFRQAIDQGKPILVCFYNPDDSVSKEIINQIKPLNDKYSNQVIFLLLKADANQENTALAKQLQIRFVPYVAVLNSRSKIIFEKTGYLDSQVMEQALYDAINK